MRRLEQLAELAGVDVVPFPLHRRCAPDSVERVVKDDVVGNGMIEHRPGVAAVHFNRGRFQRSRTLADIRQGWTPLFMNAVAVVLELGRVLQHGAVVAREYGKPCVAGIDRVMTKLHDGQKVEVDGTSGVVRLLS